MKKRKNKTTPETVISVGNANQARLRRRQEKLKNEELKAEKSRTDIFRRRVREASEQKAPKTLRTKAYYRFSKEFPSEVSPDGFRENTPESRKLSAKKKLAVLFLCIIVFSLSFTAVSIGITLSEKDPGNKTDPPVINKEAAIMGLHISPENLRTKSAEEIQKLLSDTGCNMAVFEFKSEYGYVYFPTNSFIGSSADNVIASAEEKISELSSAGIKCAAYISCFKDTVAASSLSGLETKISDGGLFLDNDQSAWLDPYSDRSQKYLLNVISAASEYDFQYILLDNICFPTAYTAQKPTYAADSNRNDILTAFINSALKQTDSASIVILGDISAFTEISTVPDEKYAGPLLRSKSTAYCLDLRAEHQNTSLLASSDMFNYVKEMPLAFILEAGSLAQETLTQEKEATLLLAVVDKSLKDGASYANHSGIENVIIW